MNVPQLILCVGPMFSGKTTSLLSYVERFKYQNKKIAAFKPQRDNRYSEDEIVSHMGFHLKAVAVPVGGSILRWLEHNMPDADVVAIDEGFMVPGMADAALKLYKEGKTVVVASLDLSSDLTPFEEIAKLLPFASRVEKFSAVCAVPDCDKDAHFTYAKVHKDQEIEVGGADKYEPRCHKHYDVLRKEQ